MNPFKVRIIAFLLIAPFLSLSFAPNLTSAELTVRLVDEATGNPLPGRVYLTDASNQFHFVKSAAPEGSAVTYDKRNWINKNSLEQHTTVSAHPFQASLKPGSYTLTALRGPESLPVTKTVAIGTDPVSLALPLRRWINMADQGWYSGDTHVHRTLEELPNALLAEDLNVALPLVYWVTQAFAPPSRGDKNLSGNVPEGLVKVDPLHVYYPRNTEYEIFSVKENRHTLGAVFVLNHKSVFNRGVPPVQDIATQAHEEGALLDLDKHNWPWSMAIIPVMNVDLYELSNNHVWRTEFAFTNWSVRAAPYMDLPSPNSLGPEYDWVEFGLKNYYALLNCGFRLRPTAGTASGVHPVPLGFSRVYVHIPGPFSYEAWIKGLDAGRSFVTTGPMLLCTLDRQQPGHVFKLGEANGNSFILQGECHSQLPVSSIEILVNGRVAQRLDLGQSKTRQGSYSGTFRTEIKTTGSSWVAVRCFEPRPQQRFRFAHTGPFHIEIQNQPLLPPKEEIDYLIERVQDEIERSRSVLPPAALAEYEKALAIYQGIAGKVSASE